MAHTVLIADDSPLIRSAIRSTIEQKTDWRVCGEAQNGKDAIQKVRELNPDIVILDVQMPVMNGLDAGREIARIAPNTPMLMFTMHRSEELVRIAQVAGIKNVLSKSTGPPDELISTIKDIFGSRSLGFA